MIPNENFACHQKLIVFNQNKNNGIGQKSKYFFLNIKYISKLCKILVLIK